MKAMPQTSLTIEGGPHGLLRLAGDVRRAQQFVEIAVSGSAGLPSVQDTESIIGKAIRDGGIDAVLDHEQGWMRSRQVADVYATAEPQSAFHARIAFCLDLHNEVGCLALFHLDQSTIA